MSENTKELQPQLAATVDEARSIKNEVTEKVAERSKDCLFLKTLPIEIRNEIYKLLLFNEDLSDIGYLEMRAYPEDEQVGYCLSPSILATCRQIYEEGQDILYGMNTFFFDTREGYNGMDAMNIPQNPLLEYRHASEIRQVPALGKVKNWKVIITGKPAKDPSSKFTLFCRALCLNPPKALEVLITGVLPEPTLPVGNATAGTLTATDAAGQNISAVQSNASGFVWSNLFPTMVRDPEGISMEEALQSLSLLRNLQSFKLRTFDSEDLSSELKSAPFQLSNETKTQLEATVIGNSPPKLAFRIYDALVDYAQAFERYEPFKNNLCASYIDVRGKHTRIGNGLEARWYSPRTIRNPYMEKPEHPVEAGMMKANLLSTGQYMAPFLEERDAVLEYLEPQYQKIAAAASTTADFIKRGKKIGFFFDPNVSGELSYPDPTELAGAMIVLEDYAKAFVRDVSSHTREHIRVMQHEFDMHYSTMPREMLLKQMSGWLVSLVRETLSVEKLSEFRQAFKAAVDDMDSQYLEIRQARKALFDYDDGRDHPIDLELGRCDEMIDWSVCEPDTESPRDPQILEGTRPWSGTLGNW